MKKSYIYHTNSTINTFAMMKQIFGIAIIVAGFGFTMSSCSKKCDVPESTDTGIIISEINNNSVIIYPESGHIYGNMGGDFHIRPGHFYEDKFEVSLDGGATRKPFESISSQYHILGNPIQGYCEISFDRDVTIDNFANTCTYSISKHDCESCEAVYTYENWVLVPAIAPGLLVKYN